MEPPGMKSWGSLDVADDEPVDERVLSHGMRELASALPFTFAGYRVGLGKEDEAGLGL